MKRLFGLLLLLCLGTATASATETISKLYAEDANGNGTYVAITNTGTISAANSVINSQTLGPLAKRQALDDIFAGASADGYLVPTTLIDGNWFFAIDPDTGFAIKVHLVLDHIVLPTGTTSFGKWTIPGGLY